MRSGLAAVAAKCDHVLVELKQGRLPRTPGSAVFLSRGATPVPPMMTRHITLFGALPEQLVTLFVKFDTVARIPAAERVSVRQVMDGFWYVEVHFGFVEIPNLLAALHLACEQGCNIDPDTAMFFAAHDDVIRSSKPPRMFALQRLLFAFQYRNAVRMSDRFALPRDRFLEIGRQVEL